MQARTKNGAIIRSYYLQLEKTIYEYTVYQHNIILNEANLKIDEANRKTQNLQFALEAEKDNLARYMKRAVNRHDAGDVVYIYQESEYMHKIGETSNANNRENDHRASTSKSKIVYTKKCCNKKLLEKVVHHILDQYRIDQRREWFEVSFEIAKEVLNSAQLFLDGLVDRCESIYNTKFYNKLDDLINTLNIHDKDNESVIIDNNSIEESIIEKDETIINNTINDLNTKNPLDFDKFILDCCIIDENLTSFSSDIYGAHRLWSRCCQKTTHDALYKYLKENYKQVKIFDPNTSSTFASFKGFSLKPINYIKDDTISDIDIFIDEKCQFNYSTRVTTKNIYAAFEEWKKCTSDPDYIINPSEKKRIDNAFSNKFVPSKVYDGKKGVLGYFCVELKDYPTNVGRKLAPSLKKKVIKIDMRTKEIIETYESLTAAAKIIGKSPSYVSIDIRFKKPIGNYIYQFLSK
jgi:hypothetical protein